MNSKISRRTFLKSSLFLSGALILSGAGARSIHHQRQRDYHPERSLAYLHGISPPADPGKLPNIVLISADDLGYGDLGAYGSHAIRTPNIDRLAAEGARLTNFYACAPLCSPSRAGMLSGRYPTRTLIPMPLNPSGTFMDVIFHLGGVYAYGVRGIPPDEVLLPEVLHARGYRTALIGKWHLGDHSPHLPNQNGFDYFYGAYNSNDDPPYAIYRNTTVADPAPADQERLTGDLTREAIQFIEEARAAPFFLNYAQPFPHIPLHAAPHFRGKSAAGLYGDVVEEIDWSVGQILETLENLGLAQNTLVIFTSDNGPWWQGDPGGLRGRKNHIFEGSFRAPLIARWPGLIPPGVVREGMSMNIDLFPTLLAAAGIAPPNDRIIDGLNLLPLLTGEIETVHQTLFYYKGDSLMGIRRGDWKYVRRHMTDNGGYASLRQGPFLFDLSRDPGESYSLLESKPEIAQDLLNRMQDWEQEIADNRRGWINR